MSVFPKYSRSPMHWKSFPALLFCHSYLSSCKIDDTSDWIVVSYPKQTGDTSNILTLGTSVK